MRKNILVPWDTKMDGMPDKLFVEEIHDTNNGKIIILGGAEQEVGHFRVHFDEALSYRNTDESYLLKTWHETPKEILGKTFYKVEESEYVEFFHEMTLGLYENWRLTHYAIYTAEDCIDILTAKPPIIVNV